MFIRDAAIVVAVFFSSLAYFYYFVYLSSFSFDVYPCCCCFLLIAGIILLLLIFLMLTDCHFFSQCSFDSFCYYSRYSLLSTVLFLVYWSTVQFSVQFYFFQLFPLCLLFLFPAQCNCTSFSKQEVTGTSSESLWTGSGNSILLGLL